MKNKIINQIIHELIPLRTLYPEIDIITNDLLNNKIDSLKEFLDNNYQDTSISPDIKNIIISLVENKKIDNTYLEVINENIKNTKLTQIDFYNFYNSKLIGFKAINIKLNNLDYLKSNIQKDHSNPNITILKNEHEKLIVSDSSIPDTNSSIISDHPKLIPIDDFKFPNESNTDLENPKLTPIDDDEILSLEENYIEKLRKSIMEAQLNYLNDANSFIQELEEKNESEIYQNLLSLNDIRFINHSIKNLSSNSLERLLEYVSNLIKENNHNSINIFIEESIKRTLHEKNGKKM